MKERLINMENIKRTDRSTTYRKALAIILDVVLCAVLSFTSFMLLALSGYQLHLTGYTDSEIIVLLSPFTIIQGVALVFSEFYWCCAIYKDIVNGKEKKKEIGEGRNISLEVILICAVYFIYDLTICFVGAVLWTIPFYLLTDGLVYVTYRAAVVLMVFIIAEITIMCGSSECIYSLLEEIFIRGGGNCKMEDTFKRYIYIQYVRS